VALLLVADAQQFDWTHDLYSTSWHPAGGPRSISTSWTGRISTTSNLGDDAVLDVGNSSVAVKGDTRVDISTSTLVGAEEAELALIELVRAALEATEPWPGGARRSSRSQRWSSWRARAQFRPQHLRLPRR
jgi:hypothetical protein